MKIMIPLCFVTLLFANLSLRSETILLKSGEKWEGSVLAQDKDSVTVKLADGNTKVFSKSVIQKVSFGKKSESSTLKKEPQISEKEKKIKEEKELAEKQKQEAEDLKAKEGKQKIREEQLSNAKRHYLEGSFGLGSGESQSELRPFFQTIQLAGLIFGSGGQVELQSTPYKTKNQSGTARLFYAWDRFTFEIRGTEAKGNFDTGGLQTLSYGGGGGSSTSTDRTTNVLLGNGETKFQKFSSRVGFTPYPHPVLDLQILAGVERIWTKTTQEVDSVGGITATGMNPNRVSYRETDNSLKGYSIGIGYEWKFLDRFTLQGQILHLDMKGPSSFRSNEFRLDATPFKFNQFGLDYQWKATGTEVNVKFSSKIKGDLSLFVEASNMTLNNKLQSGYITENDGGGNSDPSQILTKIYAPQILIPMLLDSKTVLTYVQVGANYRFSF
ncbi:LA_0442/LA_0875 N-terminal domain-containing protein [Leptospira terpstrae]|uniref:LA_0442/LA_0875 N-terminal domain-containing protein n=1 Tax=Leptospira terpstrae TaxID=293075 RepID=UPI003CFE163A